MNLKNVGLITFAGPQGCGKSIIMRCLKLALTPSSGYGAGTTCIEMSEIIRWGLEGRDQRQTSNDSKTANVRLPDVTINKFFSNWIEEKLPQLPQTRIIMVAGLPWTEGQKELLSLFPSAMVIHLKARKGECWKEILHREEKIHPNCSQKYNGDREAEFNQHWQEYIQHVTPGLNSLNSALHLDASEKIATSLEKILTQLFVRSAPVPISHRQTSRALFRVHDKKHPLHRFA